MEPKIDLKMELSSSDSIPQKYAASTTSSCQSGLTAEPATISVAAEGSAAAASAAIVGAEEALAGQSLERQTK